MASSPCGEAAAFVRRTQGLRGSDIADAILPQIETTADLADGAPENSAGGDQPSAFRSSARSPQRRRNLLAGICPALAVDVVVTLIAVALIRTGPRPAVAQPSAPVGIAPVARRTRA